MQAKIADMFQYVPLKKVHPLSRSTLLTNYKWNSNKVRQTTKRIKESSQRYLRNRFPDVNVLLRDVRNVKKNAWNSVLLRRLKRRSIIFHDTSSCRFHWPVWWGYRSTGSGMPLQWRSQRSTCRPMSCWKQVITKLERLEKEESAWVEPLWRAAELQQAPSVRSCFITVNGLDSLISQETERRNIQTNFEFGIYKPENGDIS